MIYTRQLPTVPSRTALTYPFAESLPLRGALGHTGGGGWITLAPTRFGHLMPQLIKRHPGDDLRVEAGAHQLQHHPLGRSTSDSIGPLRLGNILRHQLGARLHRHAMCLLLELHPSAHQLPQTLQIAVWRGGQLALGHPLRHRRERNGRMRLAPCVAALRVARDRRNEHGDFSRYSRRGL
jgi:hypothetical protein